MNEAFGLRGLRVGFRGGVARSLPVSRGRRVISGRRSCATGGWIVASKTHRSPAAGGVAATYAYDGEGGRVKQVSGGQTRYDCYDPLGNPVWKYTTRWKTYHLYFNGRLVFTNTVSMSPSTVRLHADHPGTVRVKSKASGRAIAGTRLHYQPFGERTGASTDPVQ